MQVITGLLFARLFGRRVVGENLVVLTRGREHKGEGEKGCMQTAVRGGLLTPFIHPSLVKPSDARGIGGSFQGFDGSSRQKGDGDCGTDGAKGQRVV